MITFTLVIETNRDVILAFIDDEEEVGGQPQHVREDP